MKATVQFFPVVLFIMLYKMVLIFESIILETVSSSEGVLSCGTVYHAIQCGSYC